MIKRKVSISDYSIIKSSIWGVKEIPNEDVKGFKIGDKAIYIKSISGNARISIRDYTTIENVSELVKCLNERYTNLDEVEYKAELGEILQDQNLGISEEERKQSLNKARQMSMAYNVGGFLLFFLSLLIFKYNPIVDFIVLIYPLAGVLIMILSKGLIKLISKKNSAYYHIFIGMYMAVIVTLIKTIVDYNVYQYSNLWVTVLACSVILILVFYVISIKKSTNMVAGQFIMAIIISFCYSYGSILKINCTFDKSPSQLYTPVIIDKHITHGKKDSYYLKLNQWAARPVHDTEVGYDLYYRTNIGQHVDVYLRKGFLNIPWFTISD
ncbi:hypothetical protein KXD93_11560 [Mucilaginibacter sp. BJC16-A38]|uniref:hypothetical protein n=1 Tax=Mucilaginibacter phenanthrenivorans TaxID=1234842 RepID=UPI0021575D3F|nr:hypothetical protein [Mucilaginibacter phenanthrenivorans]MCR8558287.1 hypothetical protein [Mucilaginibacter phenanthrenivorans]